MHIEFQNYGRSEKDKAPDNGNWDRKGSNIWINDEPVTPPTWTNAGKSINNEVDLGNENFTAREPIAVTLKEGWNKVFIKLPYVSANGVRLNKWMFTCVFTDTEGTNAVEGLIYSPNKCKDDATEQVAAKISEIKRDRGAYIGTAVGLWPANTAATIDAKIAEIEATYSATMTEEQRATQVAELTTAWASFTASLTDDNMNKPVSGNYYKMYTPLRGNRYSTGNGADAAITGPTEATTKASMWKFEARTDGSYNIINLADGTYISPASNNNTALNTVTDTPAAGWIIQKAETIGNVIVVSGSAQFNQQKDGNYYLLNWGSGTNTTDDGCEFRLIDITESIPPQPFVKIGLGTQTYPYALDAALAAEIFAKTNLTIAIELTTAGSLSGRGVFICGADSTQPTVTNATKTSSPYFAYGYHGKNLSYLASSKDGDRFSTNTSPLAVNTKYKVVFVIDKTNNKYRAYLNGELKQELSFPISGYELQTLSQLNGNENAKIYIGGGRTSNGVRDVFAGQIHSVQFFDEVLTENIIGLLEYPTTVSYPFTTEIEGYDSNNPNTHLGTVTFTSNGESESIKLAAGATAANWFNVEREGSVSCSLTREYRGFEFIGFFIGDDNLGKTPTINATKLGSISSASPLVAKFKATNDVTLFYDDDEKSYRIPAIATTSTGRIIAVSDYRHNLDDIGRDNHGTGTKRIDLVARTSDDNGKTWSNIMTIAAGDNTKEGSYLRAFGDAAIVAVGENIVVMSAAGDVLYPSATAANPNRMARIFSSDNGATWSIEEITTQMYSTEASLIPNGVAAFFGSGKLVVDANFNNTNTARIYGALLVRTYINGTYNSYNNYVVYSDDLGETWAILGGSQTPVASGDEPKVEILPNGQILLSARRIGGRIFNVFTYGTGENDKANGAGAWGTAVNGCNNGGSNATNGEIFCLDAKKADGTAVKLLLQSQPKGGSGQYDRRDVSIWYKEISATTYTPNDIASNWIQGIQVSTQQSSYSAVTLQNDGKVALFFEEAPCYGDDNTKGYSMVYVPLTTEQITGGKYFSSATDPTAATTINVTLTDANGNTYCDVLENCTLGSVKEALAEKYPYITIGTEDSYIPASDGLSYNYTNSVTLAFEVSNGSSTAWHNIYFPSNTSAGHPIYLSASSANDTYVPKVTEPVAYGNSQYNTLDNADKISWAIYNVNNSFSFTFKNKLTGKYLKVENIATGNAQNVSYADEADATAFTMVPDAASYNGDFALASVTGEATGYVCSTSASYGYATNYSGNGHQGAWVKIVEAPDYAALIANANAAIASLGDKVGQFQIAEANQELLTEAKSAMNNAGSVKLQKLNAYIALTEGATLNMPQTGGFYRISYDYGTAGVKYLQGVASSVNGVAYTADKGAESIFYYADNQLLSYTAGTYLKEEGNTRGLQGVGVAGGNVTFAQSKRNAGKYTIALTSYLHANISGSNYFSDHCSGDGGHAAHDHSIEAVEELPVTIGSVGYSTFYAPVAVAIPDGVTAYRAVINGEYIDLHAFESTIPAGQAVILQGAANTYNFTITEDVEFTGENHLLGTTKKIATSSVSNPYTLQSAATAATGVVMRRYTGENINGFKMYMSISDAQASALSFRFPGTTGIESFEAEGADKGRVYDLFGRPVENPAKGIYIIDGNKVIY